MNGSGIAEQGGGDVAEEQKTKSGIDQLAETADSLAACKVELTSIASHIRLMHDSMQGVKGKVNDISITLRNTAEAVETIAEMAAKEIAEQDQTGQNGQNEIEVPAENENS